MEDVGMDDDVRRFRVSGETSRIQRIAVYIRYLVEGLSTTFPGDISLPYPAIRVITIYGQGLSRVSSLQPYSHLMKERITFINTLVYFDSLPSNRIDNKGLA